MSDWWVHQYAEQGLYIELVSWIFWVLLSTTLHELAHGWTAIWQGDDTPIRLNHMTANPLVHLGPMSLLVFALCGVAWGAMPVNPLRFRHGRRGDLFVSAAGPAMNLLLSLMCCLLLLAWLPLVPEGPIRTNGAVFLFMGATSNILLCFLNLVPLPPADGSRMLASVHRGARQFFDSPQAPVIGSMVYVGLVFMTPIGALLWEGADTLVIAAVDSIGRIWGSPDVVYVMYAGR